VPERSPTSQPAELGAHATMPSWAVSADRIVLNRPGACPPKDQTFSSALHGEALIAAKRPELQPLIDHVREAAQCREDIRTECAGVIAGSWFANTARRGEELIAAGLLMLAGHVYLDELDKWLRVGWERRRGSTSEFGFEDS
jgi:hypothetical protein